MDLKVRGAHFLEDRHIRARPFALHGLQDLRLFAWRDGLWCMGAAATHETQSGAVRRRLVERVVLCRLAGKTLKVAAVLPSRQPREKNWMPWVRGDDLFAIYAQDPYEVLHLEKGKYPSVASPGVAPGPGGPVRRDLRHSLAGPVHRHHSPPASRFNPRRTGQWSAEDLYAQPGGVPVQLRCGRGERAILLRGSEGRILLRPGRLRPLDLPVLRHLGPGGDCPQGPAGQRDQGAEPSACPGQRTADPGTAHDADDPSVFEPSGSIAIALVSPRERKRRQPGFAAAGPAFVGWPQLVGRVQRAEVHLHFVARPGEDGRTAARAEMPSANSRAFRLPRSRRSRERSRRHGTLAP